MSPPSSTAIAAALRRLLRPLVRVLLRNGMSWADFALEARKVFVEVATQEFTVAGRKPSISRTAILTGLTRKEVSRLLKQGAGTADADDRPARARFNRAARVISGWVRDPRFHDAGGEPAPLPVESANGPSFALLVRLHGGDVPARAVLDELLRVGAVERGEDDRLHLRTRAYVPAGDADEKLAILGADAAELITTIDHNITHAPEAAWFQRKVSYDALPAAFLPRLRALTRERAQALLEELDREMAEHDLDLHPEVADRLGDASRHVASIGLYYYDDSANDPPGEDSPDGRREED